MDRYKKEAVVKMIVQNLMTFKLMGTGPDNGIKTYPVGGDTTLKNRSRRKGKDMEFLKELLGDELYTKVETRVKEHNGKEENKDNQIKLGNLGKGEYVSKAKYETLNELLKGKETELTTASGLIEQFKKDTKGNEELQGKIKEYETTVSELQTQLQELKIKAAVKIGLLSEKAADVDYLSYKLSEKLKEKGEKLEIDENGNIRGWEEKLSGLKPSFLPCLKGKEKKDLNHLTMAGLKMVIMMKQSRKIWQML